MTTQFDKYTHAEFVAHVGSEVFGPFVRPVKIDVSGDYLNVELLGPPIDEADLPDHWRSYESHIEITKLIGPE